MGFHQTAKHRNGKSRYAFKVGFDYQETRTLRMTQISGDTYKVKMNGVKDETAEILELDTVIGTKLKDKWEPGKNEA